MSTVPQARPPFDPWPASQVHVEWGATGARLGAARGDVIVVVDILSFSTTLAIAVSRDFSCLVFSPAEVAALGGIEQAAARFGARPLSRQRLVPPGQLSISPASLLTAVPGQRVLFTSLNGAAVTAAAAAAPALLVGSLRNASATATATALLLSQGLAGRVTVVPCGERWGPVEPDAPGWRPALEDWLGAGLICARLAEHGLTLSAEAGAAAAAWTGQDIRTGPNLLTSCVSARELRARGFSQDVTLALSVDVSERVPTRVSGAAEEDAAAGRLFR